MPAPIIVVILLLSCFIGGCSKVPPLNEEAVSSIIAHKINHRFDWQQTALQRDLAEDSFHALLASEMSADTAIQIALLNNPQIQAFFEELGIAQADLIEAGLLTNPRFDVEMRFPPTHHFHTNIEYFITTSLLDFLLIPLRTKLAAVEFEQTKLKVSQEILNLAFLVRETYYALIAENQKVDFLKEIAKLTGLQYEVAFEQAAVGNVNNLDLQLAKSASLTAELEQLKSQSLRIRLKEKFNQLLGLTADHCIVFQETLSENLDDLGFDLCALEELALAERLDLQIARFEITRICRMLGLKDWWSYTNLQGGLTGERESNGKHFLGPGFVGELPIFNNGRAARMRLYAKLRQARSRLAAKEIEVLAEVREAHQLLMNDLNMIAEYQQHLLPLQEAFVTSTEAYYNVMGLGIDKLLENKREQVVIQMRYVEVLRDYWLSRVMLDRALGGYLTLLITQNDSQGCSK